MSVVTAQDRAWAADLMKAFKDGDEKTVAEFLAAHRECAISCAVIRVEREFRVSQRTTQPRLATLRQGTENTGENGR